MYKDTWNLFVPEKRSRKTFQSRMPKFQKKKKHSDRINPRCSRSWALSSCPSCYWIWRTNIQLHSNRGLCQYQAAVLTAAATYRAKIHTVEKYGPRTMGVFFTEIRLMEKLVGCFFCHAFLEKKVLGTQVDPCSPSSRGWESKIFVKQSDGKCDALLGTNISPPKMLKMIFFFPRCGIC